MRALLVYSTIFISVAFMFIPAGPKVDIFFFYDKAKSAEGIAYHLFEHLCKILVFHVIQVDATKHHAFYRFMLWFQVADMIDYLLIYNEAWCHIGGIPITMNLAGAVVGAYFLYKGR